MSKVQLTDGSPVPVDRSHTEINPTTGQQKGYVVLSPEERAKGFVKPVRRSYIHNVCGGLTTMGHSLAETYARDPNFYSGTFCCQCGAHFGLEQFRWEDGEPMDTTVQADWAAEQEKLRARREEVQRERNQRAAEQLERDERSELARLKAKYECSADDRGTKHGS